MNRQQVSQQMPAFVIAGFLSGLLSLILFYTVLFSRIQESFTFSVLANIHSESPFIWFLDLIPLFTVSVSLFLFRNYQASKLENIKFLKEQKRINTEIIAFANELSSGNLRQATVDSSNEVIASLESLKTSLIINKKQEEQRKKDDNQRNRVSEGLAMFGEILRQYNDDIEQLSFNIISNLVKYLNANQGGFFLVENNQDLEPYLNMKACYAYDRRKFADRHIEWGEGIIGTCALEKKYIYMTDVPDSYLMITSGLGKSNPRVLLIVPLIANDEVHGIIELASFNKFEDYEIDFVNRVAESISLSLNNLRNTHRTGQLLIETQAQADELKRQEENARENMEALKATQELAARQADKFISFTNSVNHTIIRAEYDKAGYLLYANTKFLKKLGYSGNREVEGKHISLFINEKDRTWFNKIWEGLAGGGQHFEGYMKHITKQGQDLWTMATYTCVRKEDGDVDKILFLAIDTTEQKKQSIDIEQQISAINRLNLKSEFTPDGKVLSANELFCNTLKYSPADLESMNIFDFSDCKDLENFNEMWEKIIIGNPYQGQVRLVTRYVEEKWFRATFTAVNDMYGEVAKVIFLANEISNEKLMETESHRQTEQLKKKEEQLRLASIDLRKKLNDTNENWKKLHNELSGDCKLLENILDMKEEISISVDNTGKLLHINKKGIHFFGVNVKEIKGFQAMNIISGNGNNYPEFITNLFDPAKPKHLPPEKLIISDRNSISHTFITNFRIQEDSDRIIYNLILKDAK